MRLGLVGLGRMGFNMRDRLRAGGHEVIGYDQNPDVTDTSSLGELVSTLDAPRVVWVMVPAGEPTRQTVAALAELLDDGDLVIDGGNSKYTDDQPNAELLGRRGIGYVDVGVSGGVWGSQNGYGLMAGGSDADIQRAMPIFDALRPDGPREEGFSHAGGVGAGHYAKMIHNGIEYGMMAAFAEGYEILESSGVVTNVPDVIKGWQRGTVVRSWLLELLARALESDAELDDLAAYVEDSGEGRWTVEEAVQNRVSAPVITSSLFARFASRKTDAAGLRVVAALRNQFGGHAVKSSE